MSRSYRHHLVRKNGYGSISRRFNKRAANRVVRRVFDVPDGKAYRKFYNPWNIYDWIFQYDPQSLIFYYGGKNHIVEPDPLWKWRSK